MGGKLLMERLEPPANASDPVGQGRAIERDALARKDLRTSGKEAVWSQYLLTNT